MHTPENRESEPQHINRASTTRNPRTAVLEIHQGESEIEPHRFQDRKADAPDQHLCRACGFPRDSMAHDVAPAAKTSTKDKE